MLFDRLAAFMQRTEYRDPKMDVVQLSLAEQKCKAHRADGKVYIGLKFGRRKVLLLRALSEPVNQFHHEGAFAPPSGDSLRRNESALTCMDPPQPPNTQVLGGFLSAPCLRRGWISMRDWSAWAEPRSRSHAATRNERRRSAGGGYADNRS